MEVRKEKRFTRNSIDTNLRRTDVTKGGFGKFRNLCTILQNIFKKSHQNWFACLQLYNVSQTKVCKEATPLEEREEKCYKNATDRA